MNDSVFRPFRSLCAATVALGAMTVTAASPSPETAPPAGKGWEPCGWGGGGYFWATIFHPAKDGVIYLGLDVGGVAKTTDHGLNWRIMNQGLTNYAVYSLAVDRTNPETVYAATEDGLHKSTNGGERWQRLPNTGRKELRITAERGRSVRAIAVDPTNGNNLYAASPGGKVYKSRDGGQSWSLAYEKKNQPEAPDVLEIQFGKVNGEYYGDIWLPLEFPAGVKPEECFGFGFSFKGDKTQPKQSVLILKMADGVSYQSKNLNELFKDDQWRDVVLGASDFTLDPAYVKRNPEKAQTLPAAPDWAAVKRVDFVCSGNLPAEAYLAKLRRFFFAVTRTPDGRTGTAAAPLLLTARDFVADKTVQTIANVNLGGPLPGSVYAVAVAAKKPSLVVAATNDAGLVLSEDAGQTWRELDAPKKASCAVFAETDPGILYGSFFTDGIWKSTDTGKTWARSSEGIPANAALLEVTVSPVNPLDVYATGDGAACLSNDGGQTWKKVAPLRVDLEGNPTRHYSGTSPTANISRTKNIAINPLNPKELFIAADWRSAWSGDGGLTWQERERGADISCITDIRFSNGRVYVTAMDEGVLVSENNGQAWRQLWPLKYIEAVSGHCWRVAVNHIQGVDHIVSAFSPWNNKPKTNIVVVSEDGGKTSQVVKSGLPDYQIKPNTMWGQGYIRALAADPANPEVFYAGIDGDPEPGKSGGGIFKSEDGGRNWKQLPNQPGSRRMYYGLAVDPTDSKRIFWGSCGTNGGVWRSENGGDSWENVLRNETFFWNVLVTREGVVYASGANLWRSSDHGKSWTKLTTFTNGRAIVALEADPRDSKTLWIAATTWNGSSDGGIYKTVDGGATWQEITGNIQYVKPQILRFNPATNELWAGWVGLYKIKQ